MEDLIDNLLYAPVSGILAHNNANSDGTIVTIAHGMSLYRAILEWKNDWEKVVVMRSNRDVSLSGTIGSNPAYAMQFFVHLLLQPIHF